MNALKRIFKRRGRGLPRASTWLLSLSFLIGIQLGLLKNVTAQVSTSGTETIANTTTNFTQQNPDVSVDTFGRHFVVWESFGNDGSGFGIYGQQFFPAGQKKGFEVKINTTTNEDQRFPAIATDPAENSVIVWMDEGADGSGWGIYGQRYDNDGNNNLGSPIGSEFQVNTTTTGHQKFPDVSMSASGAFVITWQEVGLTGNSFLIKAQRYDAAGTAQGGEIEVEAASTRYKGNPQVAMAAGGEFTIVWQQDSTDGSGMGIIARRYDNTGSPLGSAFIVNPTTTANQQAPAIDMDGVGNFTIVWSSYGQDGDAEGIYGRRFTAAGTANGPEFQVSTTTVGAQTEPAIAMTREGGFTVGWSSYGQDSSFTAVYMQNYDANGTANDTAIRVNTRTTDFQQLPALAQGKAIHDLVVVWQDGLYNSTATHDGSNYGVYFQRYITFVNSPPIAVCQNITVAADLSCEGNISPQQIDNGSSDAEGTIFFTLEPPGPYPLGTTQVQLIVGDQSGLFDTCTAVITVNDSTAPIPDDPILDPVFAECSVTLTLPTATDNCGNSISATTTDPTTYNTPGTFTVNWSYADAAGNTASQTQTVTINDTQAPFPNVANLPTINAECFTALTFPLATDNCVGLVAATTADPISYSTEGTYVVTWTYSDGANTSTQQQTVIINDVTAPLPDVSTLTPVIAECSASLTAPTATDNCAGSVTATTTDPTTYNTQGTFVVTWTYDDGNGNSVQQLQTVIIDDGTAPTPDVLTLPVLTAECSVTATAPTATDNCVGSIIATTADPITYSTDGTFVISWTYDDGNGNIIQQQQTVIVDDVTAPVPNVANLPTVTDETSVTLTAPTATDNCVGSVTATTTDPLTYSTEGTYTVTWTYDDGNGNTSQQTQTVIIEDTSAPIPDVAVLPNATGECSVSLTAPTADGGLITGTTTDPTTYTTQGTFAVTWTYTDAANNSSQQTQTVIVDDVTAPVADNLPETSVGECSVTAIAPTATDNCTGSITATTTDPTTYTVIGTYNITWIFDDGNGNTSQQVNQVIVTDLQAPVPDVATLPVVTGECSVTLTLPTATDNCDGNGIIGTTNDPLTYTTEGTYAVNWEYRDQTGNVVFQLQTVIVDDITAPVPDVASLPTITSGTPVTLVPPTATDNCVGSVTAATTDPLTYSTEGTYTVTWTYDDGNGNTSQQTQTVIIEDTSAPIPDVAVLPDVTGECSASVTAPTADGGSIVGTTTDPTTYTTQGTFVVTWTYTDAANNSSQQTQTVIVDDVTAPIPDTPPFTDLGECSVTATTPTATDNCLGSITGTTTDPTTYTVFGTYNITWTFDDGNGNTSQQVNQVIVTDLQAPVPDVATLPVVTGECSVTLTLPTATDNCDGNGIIGTTNDPLTYTTEGTYAVNWEYRDQTGNVFFQLQTVIVDDITAPVPDVASLPTITSGTPVTLVPPTATDNCVGSVTAATTDPLTYSTEGTYTVTWTYDDGNGNTSQQTQTVIIEDTSAPIPDVAVLPDVTGECSASLTAPTADGGSIVGTTTDPTTYTTQGTFVVTWTYTDGSNNTSQQTQTVIVDDVTAPVPDIASIAEVTDACSVTLTAPTATDNCEGSITATTTDPVTYSTQGTFIVTWIYDDGNGNSSSQQQTVIIDDNESPVITSCPAPQNINMDVGVCSGTVPDLTSLPTATDNCGEVTFTQSPVAGSSFGQAHGDVLTVVLTANDGNGNIETCEVILSLLDTQAPTFTQCPVDIELCGAQAVFWTPPTPVDNCAILTTAQSHEPGDLFPVGTTEVSYFYTDQGGQSATCSFNVIIHELPELVIEQENVPDFCQGLASLTASVLNEGDLLGPLVYNWSNGLGSDLTVIIPDNGTYDVTVTDARGCETTESIVVNLSAEDVTAAYTLIARNGIDFTRSKLNSGGAGVYRNNRRARFYNNSEVSTFVKAPIIQKFGGSTIANEINGRANLTLPPFKANTNPTNNNIFVGVGQTRTLNGSSYGRITVSRNATLIFNNPEVYIKDLLTYRDVSIEFNQATELMVDKFIDLGNTNFFNPTGEQVQVYTEKDFVARWGSTIMANIYAKKNIEARAAFINFPTQMIGMFISETKIRSWKFVEWNANPNCDLDFTPGNGSNRQPVLAKFDDASWNVYPNPTSSTAIVELPAFEHDVEIIVYDLNGRKMLQTSAVAGVTQVKLDVTGPYFMNAIYVVQVVGEDINLSKRLQVVK